MYANLALPLFHPIGDKDVGVAARFGVAVRGKNQAFAVGREHREAVKRIVKRDLFQPRAVNVDFPEIEVAFFGVVDVGRKDYALAVGEKIRRKAGRA